MANTVLPIGGTHERQERYANAIVQLMRKELVVRSEFARDFQGSPKAGAVKVPVRGGDVALSDYNVKDGVDLTQSATTYLNIPVDTHKAINELIDGFEALAVPDNLVAQRLESAGYSTGTAFELSAIAALKSGGTASTAADTSVFKNIATDVMEIKKLGVSINDIIVIVSPETELELQTDDKFANTSGQLGAELVRNGVIGKVVGANTKMSANLGEDVEYIVFARPWAQAIDEWEVMPTINNLSDGKHIGASALQGRFIYTDVVTNPLAVRVKTSVPTPPTDPEED